MGLLSAIGAGASAILNSGVVPPVISGLFGLKQQDKANQAVNDTNDTNAAIAQQNLQFQRENLDYQKALQQQIFQREDSSYQRTVNDMRAAGISPLAMNGTNGAGEAIATTAMNNDYKDSSYMKQFPNHVESALNTYSQLVALKQNQAMNQAQIDKVNAETEGIKTENRFSSLDFANRLAKSIMEKNNFAADYVGKTRSNEYQRLQNIMQGYLNADAKRQSDYNSYFNLNPQMSPYERAASFALKFSGLNYKSSSDDMKNAFDDFTKYLFDTLAKNSKSAFENHPLFKLYNKGSSLWNKFFGD